MGRVILLVAAAVLAMPCIFAQGEKAIALPKPQKDMDAPLMEALAQRRSVRSFDGRMITRQELSNLLWAANGVNREDGKRTAPSALNKQDIEIYVCMKEGAYLYDPTGHALVPVTTEDLRPAVAGGQKFVEDAPVAIVLVSNTEKFGNSSAMTLGAMDAGYVSQNICLYCTAGGLATVPRGSMDKEAIIKGLKLGKGETPMINHPVGYEKQPAK